MAKTLTTKKPAAPARKPAKAVATPKMATPRKKALTPLGAGLVVPKTAPAAMTLTAPPPVLPAAPKKGRGPAKQPKTEPTESMGFRVPVSWATEFRAYSFNRGTKLHTTLMAAFDALKEKETL